MKYHKKSCPYGQLFCAWHVSGMVNVCRGGRLCPPTQQTQRVRCLCVGAGVLDGPPVYRKCQCHSRGASRTPAPTTFYRWSAARVVPVIVPPVCGLARNDMAVTTPQNTGKGRTYVLPFPYHINHKATNRRGIERYARNATHRAVVSPL